MAIHCHGPRDASWRDGRAVERSTSHCVISSVGELSAASRRRARQCRRAVHAEHQRYHSHAGGDHARRQWAGDRDVVVGSAASRGRAADRLRRARCCVRDTLTGSGDHPWNPGRSAVVRSWLATIVRSRYACMAIPALTPQHDICVLSRRTQAWTRDRRPRPPRMHGAARQAARQHVRSMAIAAISR